MHDDIVARRRAIEALRAGVPNGDVVRFLPPVQDNVENRYEKLLSDIETGWEEDGVQGQGFVITADFGTGKSHWLEYFRHIALERNFVCSRIVLNKETPLHDLWKVFRACVSSAELPNRTGSAMEEIVPDYARNKAPHYQQLSVWAESIRESDPRFAATLYLLDKSPSSERLEQIMAEWAGFPKKVADLKGALKEFGELGNYEITRPDRTQVFPYFEFASRFFRSRGYAGWILLVDETEMISRYSVRQRGRAYAHLAMLLGKVKDIRYPATASYQRFLDAHRGMLPGKVKPVDVPGLASVFTITPDYAGVMIDGKYRDKERIPEKLKGTRDEPLIAASKEGMKTLENQKELLRLEMPSGMQVDEIHRKVRELYGIAYEWSVPEISRSLEMASTTKIRHHVRSWINTWDLQRLYNLSGEVEIEDIRSDLGEDADFQEDIQEDRNPDEDSGFIQV